MNKGAGWASLIIVLAASAAQAAWSTNPAANTLVFSNAATTLADLSVVADPSGGAYLVWDAYFSSLGTRRVQVQRLDALGQLAWPAPIGVTIATNQQTLPVACRADNGDLLVGWREEIKKTPSKYPLYIQRITPQGTRASDRGLALTSTNWNGATLRLVSDGANGVLAAWRDGRTSPDLYDVYAQRVGASGTVMWNPFSYGVPVATNSTNQYVAIVSDGSGGAVLAWERRVGGTDYDIYAQRVQSNGVVLWTAGGNPVCVLSNYQGETVLAPDGMHGVYLAWHDARTPSRAYDVYAQHLNSQGSRTWSYNGIGIWTNALNSNSPQIIPDGATGAVISAEVWNEGFSDCDLIAQRINLGGGKLWGNDGSNVAFVADHQWPHTLFADGAGGAMVAWLDNRGGTYRQFVQHLDARGLELWQVNGVLAGAAIEDYAPAGAPGKQGGAILGWLYGPSQVRAQRVNANGVLGGPLVSLDGLPLLLLE